MELTDEGSKCDDKLLLTFDDGKHDHHEIVVPILRDLSMRTTFFVIPECLGKADFLDWFQLREMDRQGCPSSRKD